MDIWEPIAENLLKTLAEKSEGLAWMHYKSSRFFSIINACITFVTIVLTTFICAFSFSRLSCELEFFHWLLGTLGGIATILSFIYKSLEPSQMAQKHLHAFSGYSSLYREVLIELSLKNDMRSSPHEFVSRTNTSYDHLAKYSPSIPDFIVNQYKTRFAHKTVKPEIANGFSEIVIST